MASLFGVVNGVFQHIASTQGNGVIARKDSRAIVDSKQFRHPVFVVVCRPACIINATSVCLCMLPSIIFPVIFACVFVGLFDTQIFHLEDWDLVDTATLSADRLSASAQYVRLDLSAFIMLVPVTCQAVSHMADDM